ncbi:MAG: hypothetical protein CJBNEKGG_01495 [Prosthecobacter sp.]|nr:hypothetical protein [Prosthecobacter sp.]
MPEPSLFRHYLIVQDGDGNNVELTRNAEQVNVLGFDTRRLEFVQCHVMLEPLKERASFEAACRRQQEGGHALLARLVDFGEDEGNPYYITGNVDGETLASYLARQPELPGWLALLLASRAVEAVLALAERNEAASCRSLEQLRVVQTGAAALQVHVADYVLTAAASNQARAPKVPLARQAGFLRSFLEEKASAVAASADLVELLSSCLESTGGEVLAALKELRAALSRMAEGREGVEIPTALKPRPLLAPQLAGYQEVARALVNRVRIQSQRLDMTNPYAMRGTLTKTGRAVLVEQVPPVRLATEVVQAMQERACRLENKGSFPGIIPVVLVHEADGILCLAEEVVEGISLADLLLQRRALNVHETYLVLAGLDAALTQLESSGLEPSRLRLEDIHLLTGFPREDARSLKLLLTKLTDWPAFSIMLRAHPTLASMAGRGTDPSLLLSAPRRSDASPSWDAAWLSAVGRFLLALEPLPGAVTETPGTGREIELVAGLLDEEIAKSRDGMCTKRGEFLARYARLVHHHDLVKPVESIPSGPLEPVKPRLVRSRTAGLQQIQATPMPKDPVSPLADPPLMAALTEGGPSTGDRPSVGFAELLFRGTSVTTPVSGPDWAKTAADAPPTIHADEALLPPDEFVPFWLRAAVFLGGSMIAGAMLAHFSGDAMWQQKAEVSGPQPSVRDIRPASASPAPRAQPLTKAASVPEAVVVPEPAALPPPPDPVQGSSLLKAPQSTLRQQLGDLPASPR